METTKYKLYAIYTKHLAKDELKGFEYSLVANNRYALVFTDRELTEPYKQIQNGVTLEKNEREWLLSCKFAVNNRAMKENESEYSEVLNEFAIALEKELKAEQEKLNGEKQKGVDDNA